MLDVCHSYTTPPTAIRDDWQVHYLSHCSLVTVCSAATLERCRLNAT